MKPRIQTLLSLLALIVGLSLILAGQAMAQTFTNLYSFGPGEEGEQPFASLILSGNTLYGTTYYGAIYGVDATGGGAMTLHAFSPGTQIPTFGYYTNPAVNPDGIIPYTNSDGGNPQAGLILSGNILYGTALGGGSTANGTVFAVNTGGTTFTNLHSFGSYSNDGAYPHGTLLLSGNLLYGTTMFGGTNGNGTVFKVNTNGTGYTNLYSFAAGSGSFPNVINSGGANPADGLILSGNTLYGTAQDGGSNGFGTVFSVNIDGTGFTNIYTFKDGNDGAYPIASLILSGNTLYGTAYIGGSAGNGTVFALNTNGMGFTTLHYFTGSDGANPYGGLILSGNILYGTTKKGGSSGKGTVFALNSNANGNNITSLHIFSALGSGPDFTNTDGAEPNAGLVLYGNTLYGTADEGGNYGDGTVFGISLPPSPQLAISLAGANVVLTWTTNSVGFTLQSTTNLISTNWSAVSPAPVVVNTNNVVTNSISGRQLFYRLSQ
jgi:uncharacterized repeat protein (TIGR03803 family)